MRRFIPNTTSNGFFGVRQGRTELGLGIVRVASHVDGLLDQICASLGKRHVERLRNLHLHQMQVQALGRLFPQVAVVPVVTGSGVTASVATQQWAASQWAASQPAYPTTTELTLRTLTARLLTVTKRALGTLGSLLRGGHGRIASPRG